MPRGKAAPLLSAAIAAGLTVAGCAPGPEAVRLALPTASQTVSPSISGAPNLARTIPATSANVPAADERSVASHLDASRVAEALERLSEEQRQELAMLTERLYAKKLEALHTNRADELAAATAAYSKDREKVWDDITAVFLAQADAMGRDRIRLASLVGFPDPDPNSRRRARRTDLAGQVDLEKAAVTRKSIAEREDEFWTKVEALSMPVRSAYVDKLRQIATKYMTADQRAHEDAKAEAAEILSGATSEIETPSVDFGVFIPAAPAQEVKLAPMGVTTPEVQSTPAPTAKAPAVNIFLKLKNYRLAKPGEPSRDVTKEFVEWNRLYNAGH